MPVAPSAPSRNTATTTSQLVIDWTAITADAATGGSAITSYGVYWDAGTSGSSYVALAGVASTYTSTTYTQSTGITAGSTYKFYLMAQNVWGWSPIGSVLSIVAATVPDQMDTVTTSIDSSTGGVIIAWNEPSLNSGAILSYSIEIANGANTTWTASASCDGSDATIKSLRTCTIPMSELTSTYAYSFNQLVEVRATSTNAYGSQTTYSYVNGVGASTRKAPD